MPAHRHYVRYSCSSCAGMNAHHGRDVAHRPSECTSLRFPCSSLPRQLPGLPGPAPTCRSFMFERQTAGPARGECHTRLFVSEMASLPSSERASRMLPSSDAAWPTSREVQARVGAAPAPSSARSASWTRMRSARAARAVVEGEMGMGRGGSATCLAQAAAMPATAAVGPEGRHYVDSASLPRDPTYRPP